MTVIVKSQSELVVPKSVRRKAGLKSGDRVQFKVTGRTISIVPSDDEHTPAERRAIDRGIARSQKDYKEGASYGPFQTHDEFIASLHAESVKLRGKKKNKTHGEMTVRFSRHFLRSYHKAPDAVRKAFDKQSLFLLEDLHHPSLHAKKYDESRNLWQARVNYHWRFYFRIAGDVYLMDEIKRHPK